MENITGNITADAVTSVREIKGKKVTVTNFTVAENKTLPGGQEMTRYIKVALWRKWGDALAPYLKEGKEVSVEGYLESEGWVGKDGKARSNLIIKSPYSVQLRGKKKMTAADAGEDVFAGAQA